MIVPITFQGVANFSASRYALEVRSRFIDQNNAHGFYAGYGEELDAVIIGNTIKIKSGAFLISGRQFELVNDETVTVTIENGKVGYIVARVESFHPEDEQNICRFSAKNGTSLGGIALMQENLYSITADEQNTVFELPIYSYSMSGGVIKDLNKLLKPIADYFKAYDIAEQAKSIANTADGKSDTAISDSSEALGKANAAIADSGEALSKANTAIADSATAVQTSQAAVQQIVYGHGTRIKKNNVQLTDLNIDNFMETNTHIDTTVPGTPTDSKVYSSKLAKAQLALKANAADMATALSGKINTSDIDTTVPGTATDTKVYSSKLAKAELAKKADTSSLKLVATSGSYNDLSNKPTIPAAVTVVNSLTSTSTTNALSAAQGKALNDRLTSLGFKQASASITNSAYVEAIDLRQLGKIIYGTITVKAPSVGNANTTYNIANLGVIDAPSSNRLLATITRTGSGYASGSLSFSITTGRILTVGVSAAKGTGPGLGEVPSTKIVVCVDLYENKIYTTTVSAPST